MIEVGEIINRLKYAIDMLSRRIQIVSLLTSIIAFVLGIVPLLAQSPGPATVTVKITGLRSEKGQVKSPYSIRPPPGSAIIRRIHRQSKSTVGPSCGN